MKTVNSGLVTGLLAVAVASSCSTMRDVAENPDERVCINTNAVRTFDALSDRYVYVREGSDKHYLLTMRYKCIDLRHATRIAIRDTTSSVCSKGFGELLYSGEIGGRGLESCPIDTIEQVTGKEQAKSLTRQRTEAAKTTR